MAYSFDELLAVLKTAGDPTYLAPILEADYGSGREVYEGLIEVLMRCDQAIERTTQSMYILPWSGQTDAPAAGESYSILSATVTRTLRTDRATTIAAGAVLFEERSIDPTTDGGLEVATGRQYVLTHDITFLPGVTGPLTVEVIANRPGFGHACIELGAMRGILQPGAAFQNLGATVTQSSSTARLTVTPDPDVIVPDHVGQYVEFVGGANAGRMARIIESTPADPAIPSGGAATLMGTFVGRSIAAAPGGAMVPGETVQQVDAAGPTIIAEGRVCATSTGAPWYIAVDIASGEFRATAGTIGPVVGLVSGATFTVEDVEASGKLVPEVGTAAWRVVPWTELGLSITNTGIITAGNIAMLDALGDERNIPRASGESDSSYRQRVWKAPDVVSPNAIRRIGNRIWAPYGAEVCLREVGSAKLPGMYFDTPGNSTFDSANCAYDIDGAILRGAKVGEFFDGEIVMQDNGGVHTIGRVTSTIIAGAIGGPVPLPDATTLEVAVIWGPGFVLGVSVVGSVSGSTMFPTALQGWLRATDRFKTWLDYTEFRAFFLVGVPASNLGEFGLAYDGPFPYGAFDASPYAVFYDGFARTAAELTQHTWQGIDRARAGGVGFDLYLEDVGCI